ncbi:hypothetical protein [Streptomyces sp. KLOTTS4A1]|uniref:hypothetical protein n=1 Tax=Streptomyces sp. KLOTTS4A1 TaxID=3390996 RepID=UPI0039F46855
MFDYEMFEYRQADLTREATVQHRTAEARKLRRARRDAGQDPEGRVRNGRRRPPFVAAA